MSLLAPPLVAHSPHTNGSGGDGERDSLGTSLRLRLRLRQCPLFPVLRQKLLVPSLDRMLEQIPALAMKHV